MGKQLELFPSILLRVAGEHILDLQQTNLSLTPKTIAKYYRTHQKSVRLQPVISAELYSIIPLTTDDSLRQFWITVRRAVHNDRTIPFISSKQYAKLPTSLRHKLREYTRLQDELRALEEKGSQQYTTEVKVAKHAFKAILQKSDNFQNGLLLSSSTISVSLKKYLESDIGVQSSINKKERSFMEYLSRIYTKPSPFSSFTHIATPSFSSKHRGTLVSFDSENSTSYVHLNQELFQYLHGLLINHPIIRQLLPVTLNSTIRKNDSYLFLVNHYNHEAFQSITATPALDLLHKLMSREAGSVSFRELLALLTKEERPIGSAKDVSLYLDGLVRIGFFDLNVEVSGMDRDWDTKLSEQLTKLAKQWPQLKDTAKGLTNLREFTQAYQTATLEKRQYLRNEASEIFSTICKNLEATLEQPKEAGSDHTPKNRIFQRSYPASLQFKPHHLWYEDTVLTSPPIMTPKLKSSLQVLGDLLSRMESFDRCQKEQETMADFFRRSYGADAVVDVLRFFRDYTLSDEESKKYISPATIEREDRNKKTLEHILKRFHEQAKIYEAHFGRDDLKHLPPTRQQASLSALFQAYPAGRKVGLILNLTNEGSGRMFSRFLHLIGEDTTERIRQTAAAQSGDRLFAEVTDASFYNGNLHPPLMPYEIATPGGHATRAASAQLYINDLDISYSETRPRKLMLIHRPSGKEVIVFNLGLQEKKGRSKLYNFLCHFRLSPHHNVYELLDHVNQTCNPDGTGITILPRVVYEDCIVLQRKAWRIPKDRLPERTSAETDWDYFLRLRQWRQELRIPEEVFIKGSQYKPQYIAFNNPFLVSIFESNVRNCGDSMLITEMLPTSDQFSATGGRAVEFLAQWDKV